MSKTKGENHNQRENTTIALRRYATTLNQMSHELKYVGNVIESNIFYFNVRVFNLAILDTFSWFLLSDITYSYHEDIDILI